MGHQQETEESLINGCLRNDPAFQKMLYYKYSDKMYAICLRYSNNTEAAKDILQDGFVRVFKSLPDFAFRGSFEGWVRRIMVNTAIEYYRKEIKNYSVLDIETVEEIEVKNTVIDNLSFNDLIGLISQLPTGYRTVFNMFAVEGFSHKEIADQLGISENTSKTQMMKARFMLQKLMAAQKIEKH